MGKEAKIGLAVILGLFIVLGVVLALRLSGSKDKPLASITSTREKDSPAEKNASATQDGKGRTSVSSQPTVVSAHGGSNTAAKQTSADLGRWSTASDSSGRRETTAGQSGALPPSYMPNPSASRYDRYAGTQTYPTWQQGQADASGPTAKAQSYDPYQRTTGQAGSVDAGRANPRDTAALTGRGGLPAPPVPDDYPSGAWSSENPLRGQVSLGAGNTGGRTASVSQESGAYRYASSGTYPSAASSSQPTSSYRQGSRYGYPQLEPSQPTRQSATLSSLSDSGTLSSRYGGEHLRRSDGTYKVQPNDNYWAISERLYGAGAYFKALAEHNRERTPREDRLEVGAVILAPTVAELEQRYPDLCPKPSHRKTAGARATTVSTPVQYGGRRVYVVEEGDTLFDIARNELGKASRWGEIYELNRDKLGEDCDYLAPGTQLVLPDANPADAVTRRPGSAYRR